MFSCDFKRFILPSYIHHIFVRISTNVYATLYYQGKCYKLKVRLYFLGLYAFFFSSTPESEFIVFIRSRRLYFDFALKHVLHQFQFQNNL